MVAVDGDGDDGDDETNTRGAMSLDGNNRTPSINRLSLLLKPFHILLIEYPEPSD